MTTTLLALLFMIMVPGDFPVDEAPTLEGVWKLIPEKSTDLATWRSRALQLAITAQDDGITVVHSWIERSQVAFADTFVVRSRGTANRSIVRSAIWPDNWYMGVLSDVGATRSVSGEWVEKGTTLRVVSEEPVRTSQGNTTVTTKSEYRLARDGATLTLTQQRSSRRLPVILVFERVTAVKP